MIPPHAVRQEDFRIGFPVVGAGTLYIGRVADSRCGKANGFVIGVSWGDHGDAGGVMDAQDATRLAKHILDTLEKLRNNP